MQRGKVLVLRISGSCFGLMIGLALAGGCVGAGGQEKLPTVVPDKVPEGPRVQASTSFKVPLLSRVLRLQDFLSMEPVAEVKGQLAEVSGFTQSSPTNGAVPTEKTEVYVGRTRTTLQVGFVCHDAHPGLIRRHMARRENILTDDNVGILLDPFADRRHGILFQVNALGVQADAAYTEGGGNGNSNEDYSYDQVWESAATITAKGWVAVMSIPFTSLRFREGGLPWGFVAMRSLPRNSEEDEFPAINANIAGELSQEGLLTGIEGVTGSHNVQLNPYGLLQNEHDLNSLDSQNPFFSNRRLAGTVGGDAKVIVKDSVVLDATINPDFSQVESDQPQFTVNQRYPVYFPELRPFFLENANYFATPIDLVYTRNIVHPEFGGRATGKIGKTNLGILAIDDRGPGEVGNSTDVGFGQKALFAIGRVSEDLGKQSNVGLLYTDEEFAGSWNRVGGVDFTARLGQQVTLSGQTVASSTKGLDGSYAAGPASQLSFVQSNHRVDFQTTYKDYSEGFQSTTGFIQTTAFRQDSNNFHYKWYPKNSVVQEFGLEESGQFAFDRLGNTGVSLQHVRPVCNAGAEYSRGGAGGRKFGYASADKLSSVDAVSKLYGEFCGSGAAQCAGLAVEFQPGGAAWGECKLQPYGLRGSEPIQPEFPAGLCDGAAVWEPDD